MPEAVIYPDDSLSITAGLVVDGRPLSRGDHEVGRYWLDPAQCQAVGGIYPSAAPAQQGGEPYETTLGETNHSAWSVRAMMVTSPSGGIGDDLIVWDQALRDMAVKARHLHRPSRERVLEMITKKICKDVDDRHTALVILSGRATPTGGGAFHLEGEVVTYRTLLDTLDASCAAAGLIVLVIDAGYAGAIEHQVPPRVPTLIWRASDSVAPWGPRVAPARGGLLSQALATEIGQRAQAHCLGVFHAGGSKGYQAVNPSPTLVATVFQTPDLLTRMRQLRWLEVGIAALQDKSDLLTANPSLEEGFKDFLYRDIPGDSHLAFGTPNARDACSVDNDCKTFFSGCPIPKCRRWGCVEGQCELVDYLGASCDDDNPCTTDDECKAGGVCVGVLNDCDDDNSCTTDSCEGEAGCVHFPKDIGLVCDDADVCTEGERCDAQGACTGEAIVCEDENVCTADGCDPVEGCTYEALKGACDDGVPCTHQDYCKDGQCTGVALPCDDGNPCTLDLCDEALGTCVHPPDPAPGACTDANACTVSDVCVQGECTGTPLACDDGVDCTLDGCQEGSCTHLPAPNTCLSSEGCIAVGESAVTDPCRVCVATNLWSPLDNTPCLDDGVACTDDVCVAGKCVHVTDEDHCVDPSGTCISKGELLAPCLVCAGGGVAQLAGNGVACDDGDACTTGDVCDPDAGCSGQPVACCPAKQTLGCGDTIIGDTSLSGATDIITNWGCAAPIIGGVEEAHPFIPDCSGVALLNVVGPSGTSVIMLNGSCEEGDCLGYSFASLSMPIEAAESYAVVIQTPTPGTYELKVTCTCSPEP